MDKDSFHRAVKILNEADITDRKSAKEAIRRANEECGLVGGKIGGNLKIRPNP